MPRLLARLSAVLLAVALLSPAHAEINFGLRQVVAESDVRWPSSVVVEDLDGDLLPDVVASGYNATVWYQNLGGLAFGPAQVLSTGFSTDLQVADLDADGDPDIVAALGNRVAWFENSDGAGGFLPPAYLSGPLGSLTAVHVADIDGDAQLDVLAAASANDTLGWFRHVDGNGLFGAQRVITNLADGANSVWAADFDGDGDLDVVGGSYFDEEVAWYENVDGLGMFGPQQVIAHTVIDVTRVAVSDVDGDLDPDILVLGQWDFQFATLVNDGLGGFTQGFTQMWNNGPEEMAIGDLDGDSDPDVLVTHFGGLYRYLNDGTGTYARGSVHGGYEVLDVAIADLDGSGDVESISAVAGHNQVMWLEDPLTSNGFDDWNPVGWGIADTEAIAAGDIDGDGDPDLAAVSSRDQKVVWLEYVQATGTFVPWVLDTAALLVEDVRLGDIDGDTDLDVIVALRASSGPQVLWYENRLSTTGDFSSRISIGALSGGRAVYPAYVDEDAFLDIVAVGDRPFSASDEVSWFRNVDGTGTSWTKVGIAIVDGPRDVAVGDLDGDGDQDVVVGVYTADQVVWYENVFVAGVWQSFAVGGTITTLTNSPYRVRLADLDGDGDLDVLSASYSDSKLAWYANDGSGVFGAQIVLSSFGSKTDVQVGDFDQDGDLDLAGLTYNDIQHYENTGGGTFASAVTLDSLGADNTSVDVADFDQDGWPDIVYAQQSADGIFWLRNLGDMPCTTNPCPNGAACVDLSPGYSCDCTGTGYSGTTCQTDINECVAGTDGCDVNPNATCRNLPGSFECVCLDGYAGDGVTCTNVDECSLGLDSCLVVATCTDTDGGFTCACPSGYLGDGVITCDDIDECTDGTDDCLPVATCMNVPGGFTCDCPAGYTGDGRTACDDLDECATGADDCHADATCTNTVGSFDCACNSGYTGDGRTACDDVDECAAGTDDCLAVATCMNVPGGFTCECPAGYAGDGRTACDDIDECATGADDCHADATCSNTDGSFDCACNAGYTGDGRTACDDVDECTAGTDDCLAVATCVNTAGSFTCDCPAGYAGDGRTACDDVDECATGADDCHADATCSNTDGSFDCACNSGYAGDGRTACDDVDECATGADDCLASATCSNTVGGFDCACNAGYTGDGRTACDDLDECALGTDSCDANATCGNTVGAYTCSCNDGYTGDGIACTDVDECTNGTHECDPDATCTNTAGSYTCECNEGFTGDGTTCEGDPIVPETGCGCGSSGGSTTGLGLWLLALAGVASRRRRV